MGFMDRVSGRLKKAAGDLTGDKGLQRQGDREERKADAKEDLERAHENVEEQAARVRDAEVEAEAKRQRRR
ncbi:MAG TPA: CsbD family protein [Thermoleophilaceae bacterium]|nr:CsbD family protein [Thermoleophilaceae bacterium]